MSEKTSFNSLIQGDKAILVDFSAEWCGPCKMMAPILKELAASHGEQLRILKVDVDKNPGPASVYQITGVPTLILFQNGKILWRQSGVVPIHQLRQIINQYISQ